MSNGIGKNPLNDISKVYVQQVVEKKKDDTYLEPDMKKRQANNEKARKDMEKMGTSMKNPHFESVEKSGWDAIKACADGYKSVYDKQEVEEVYKGKHGQSDKEYAASRSQGGKMISGDDKRSGAEYTHGRRVKAANPGMQPDVGGKTKPKSQGKMDAGTRADLKYRKANLKKESYTVTNADKKGNTKAYQNYKAGMKGKDGKPLYKAADHMKEDNIQEVAPALAAVAGKMAAGAATKGIAAKGAGIAAKGAMRKKAVDFAAKKGGEMVGNKVTNMLQGNNEEFMPEKAESKAQQRLMGLALSVQRGDTPRSSVSPEVLKMAREMKEKDLKDFAGTKHEGLPEKVKKEEPEFSSPLVESLITENIAKQMAMKARREEQRAKSIDRKASAAQQRVGLNVKK